MLFSDSNKIGWVGGGGGKIGHGPLITNTLLQRHLYLVVRC